MKKLCTLVLLLVTAIVPAEQVRIVAGKDTTLYEDGAFSNGAGDYLFAGKTNNGILRRALLQFDVAGSVPAGAQIDSATVEMTVSKTVANALTVELHRAQASWGEGASDASGEEGLGADAATGDATWQFRLFDTDAWTTAGGDFTVVASGTASVDLAGTVAHFTGEGLTADVAAWLDGEANFGWFVIGDESVDSTAKRFNSRTNSDTETRPVLIVDYTVVVVPKVADQWVVY